jgi:predicted TIM-barrel fold metal-dependent hydrolase
MIRGSAPEDQPYSGTIYDPLWQAASELEMPLSLHIVTGGTRSPVWQMVGHIAKSETDTPGIAQIGRYQFYPADIQVSLYTLVISGVLERFPKLKIVSAESDTGWLPHFMYRLDHGYNKYWANAGIANSKWRPAIISAARFTPLFRMTRSVPQPGAFSAKTTICGPRISRTATAPGPTRER